MSQELPRPSATTGAGYERSDVKVNALVWLALTILMTVAAICVGLWLLVELFEARAKRADPEIAPLAEQQPEPPGPQLQRTPVEEYQTLRQTQEETLNSYGWVDREKGIVRIPISRAMDLTLKRGLPAPKAPEAETP